MFAYGPAFVFGLILVAQAQPGASSLPPVTIPNCIVSLIDDVDVPAQAEGVLQSSIPLLTESGEYLLRDGQPQYQPFRVREGMSVQAGQGLALVDDSEAWKTYLAALARLEGAEREAGNDVAVRAAEKAWEVSKVEVRQAEEANRRAPGSVPYLELNRLYLQRDQLELQKQKAEHDLELARMGVKIRRAEADGAWLALHRRVIRAPVSGMVVEVYRDLGEWVKPGDAVVRIVRMDRMRIEGYLAAGEVLPSEIADQPVRVQVSLRGTGGAKDPQPAVFMGQVVFVSPVVEAGGRYLVWAEVENRQEGGMWVLRPGLTAEMTIARKPSR